MFRPIILVILSVVGFLSCDRNGPGIPPGLNYFTLGDKTRMARFRERDFIAERVDPNDTGRVLVSRKLSSYYFIQLHTSKVYGQLFELNDNVFQPGLNNICRVRFRYEGLPGVVDWLEFKNTAEEWVSPTDVKFNGKPIQRIDSNEPVAKSYLYVLE